jgi:hypothetical protein
VDGSETGDADCAEAVGLLPGGEDVLDTGQRFLRRNGGESVLVEDVPVRIGKRADAFGAAQLDAAME